MTGLHLYPLRAKAGANVIDAMNDYEAANSRIAAIACAEGMLDGLIDWIEQAIGSRLAYEALQQRADIIAAEMAKTVSIPTRRE
jgi:hypothetical protein